MKPLLSAGIGPALGDMGPRIGSNFSFLSFATLFCVFRLFRRTKNAIAMRKRTAAATPTPMPALAPELNVDVDDVAVGVDEEPDAAVVCGDTVTVVAATGADAAAVTDDCTPVADVVDVCTDEDVVVEACADEDVVVGACADEDAVVGVCADDDKDVNAMPVLVAAVAGGENVVDDVV